MDRQDIRNDELDGHEPAGGHGRSRESAHGSGRARALEEDGEDGEATYPPGTTEDHVAGAREPIERSSVEPENSRLEDRTRMRDIMKRVNDALHRVRPKE